MKIIHSEDKNNNENGKKLINKVKWRVRVSIFMKIVKQKINRD